MLSKVLEETSKPLFIIIKNWLLYGELQDPHKEFFVDINEDVQDDDIWNSRYILNCYNVPNFFNRSISEKIFEIGKCVNFIRKYCDDPTYSLVKLKTKIHSQLEIEERIANSSNQMMIEDKKSVSLRLDENAIALKNIENYKKCVDLIVELDNDKKMNMNTLPQLYSHVEILHKEMHKETVSILYKRFKFKAHLNSINRYLLLGQGDMMQYLMDLLFNELKKPATQIYKHNLLSILETAIRASNAQYHDPQCLDRLSIKLMDSSTGDTGWDIFVLEYNVDTPLNVIFTKPVLKEYQKLFFFFWKLKRLEFSHDHQIWRNFMTYSHSLRGRFEHLRPFIQRAILFNHQIIHFVTTLHNYITLEVLETQYKKLVENLDGIESVDELIRTHTKFVEIVIGQSLLNSENALIYEKIRQISDLVLRFKTAQVNRDINLGCFNSNSVRGILQKHGPF